MAAPTQVKTITVDNGVELFYREAVPASAKDPSTLPVVLLLYDPDNAFNVDADDVAVPVDLARAPPARARREARHRRVLRRVRAPARARRARRRPAPLWLWLWLWLRHWHWLRQRLKHWQWS